MYVPKHFSNDDAALTRRMIDENPFAVLLTLGAEPVLSHLPLLMVERDGQDMLIGHVAKANPQERAFDGATDAIAVFSGPHAYVSPNWYQTPGMVPTWNYAAVHVHGRPRVVADPGAAQGVLETLVRAFETDATGNWSMSGLDDARIAGQLKGIVAFEMPVDKVESKLKMSQNRSAEDAAGVINALSESTRQEERATADIMRGLEREK